MQIGIDIEDISRFEGKTLESDKFFLKRIFSEKELEYCFSNANPAPHLCARFCAKEALIKALSDKSLELNKIEVIKSDDGKPYFNLVEKYRNLKVELSLSHCKAYACASVLVY